MNHPISEKGETYIFYSKDNRSFTGKEVIPQNKPGMGSAWKLIWVPMKRNFEEYEFMDNTNPELYNREEVQKWIEGHF